MVNCAITAPQLQGRSPMVAASKAKPPQVTGDVLRASGSMLLSHLATHPSAVPLGLTFPRPAADGSRPSLASEKIAKAVSMDHGRIPQLSQHVHKHTYKKSTRSLHTQHSVADNKGTRAFHSSKPQLYSPHSLTCTLAPAGPHGRRRRVPWRPTGCT